MLINIWRGGVRRKVPGSFQLCPATGQGKTGTTWSIGSSTWTWGRSSPLWQWRSTGTVCLGGLWSLLLWKYSRPAWTRSCAVCCMWPCFGRGVGLDDPQRSLPTPNILGFCDSALGSSLCPSCGPSPTASCPACSRDSRAGHRTPGVVSPEQSRGAESPPSTCWSHFYCCRPGYSWSSEPRVHIARSCQTFHAPNSPI